MIVGYLLVHKKLDEQYFYRLSNEEQTEQNAVVSAYGYFRNKYPKIEPMYPTSFTVFPIKVSIDYD